MLLGWEKMNCAKRSASVGLLILRETPFHQLNCCSNVLIARGAAYSFKLLVQQKKENIRKEKSVNVSLPSGSSVFKSSYDYYKKKNQKGKKKSVITLRGLNV